MRSFFLLALLSASAQAQPQITARVQIGAESHGEMSGLGTWQALEQERFEQQGIPAAVTDAFPGYVSVFGGLGVRVADLQVGVQAGYSSAGGRIAYSDYSGSLVVDRVAERLFVGLYGESLALRAGPARIGGGLAVRLNRTTVAYRRDLQIGDDEVESVETELRAAPLSIQPSAIAEITVFGPLQARAQVGWELSQEADLMPDGDLPVEARSNDLRVGWSGARASAGLVFHLGS